VHHSVQGSRPARTPQSVQFFITPHSSRALAQRDLGFWPSADACPIGCDRRFEIIDASNVLDDAVTGTIPNIDAERDPLDQLDNERNRIWGAEGLQRVQLTRIVPSETTQRIAFLYALTPDSSSSQRICLGDSLQHRCALKRGA
jgi:hypothetical protein